MSCSWTDWTDRPLWSVSRACARTNACRGKGGHLSTDDRGKTIDDGSSSSTFSTPFSFGNCLMPAVELDAARLVGTDRSRVLERVHEYLEANASFDSGQLQDIWSSAPEAVFFNLNGHTYKGSQRSHGRTQGPDI